MLLEEFNSGGSKAIYGSSGAEPSAITARATKRRSRELKREPQTRELRCKLLKLKDAGKKVVQKQRLTILSTDDEAQILGTQTIS